MATVLAQAQSSRPQTGRPLMSLDLGTLQLATLGAVLGALIQGQGLGCSEDGEDPPWAPFPEVLRS